MLSSELFAMFAAIAIIMPLFTDGTEARKDEGYFPYF